MANPQNRANIQDHLDKLVHTCLNHPDAERRAEALASLSALTMLVADERSPQHPGCMIDAVGEAFTRVKDVINDAILAHTPAPSQLRH